MTEKKMNPDDDNIGKLVERVGPREELPEVIKARLTRTFKDELANARIARRRVKVQQYLSMAAVLMLAVAVTWLYPTGSTTIPSAQVMVAKGEVDWITDQTRDVLRQGNRINLGDRIETGADGRVNLAVHDTPTSIRLDVNTKIAFTAVDELLLVSGRIYVDSGMQRNDGSENPLKIIIDGITINHLGTQYLVGYVSDQVSVAVREGTVQVKVNNKVTEGYGTSTTADLLDIDKDGNVNRSSIPRHNSQWKWVNQVSPTFYTDQRRIIEFLEWHARETGRELKFKDRSVERIASEAIIYGNHETNKADEALQNVMDTTRLRARIVEDNVVVIDSI